MKHFKVIANKNYQIGKIEDTLHSSFIEHLGRAVYHGIYEPTHETANADGFRMDVADVIKKLNLSLVRYPGGNFVSGYFWEDGIGPKENRPTKKEEAWKSIETNEIGTDEFMKWTKLVGVSPMMAVNLGSGTTDNARNLVEYCNANDDSKYANLRRKYGSKEPYKVKYWCLGNEMDGEWQIGHLNSVDYSKKALEAAKKMREVDPDIKFIACGSSGYGMPTFPEWDRVVVDTLYDDVDYLSIHQYYFENSTEADYYASYHMMDNYISACRNMLEYLNVKHRNSKRVYLCFDEYNIWYNTGEMPADYTIAPPILQERQSFKDCLVFGGLLNTLINNCDIVKIACLAQLINVIAPICTEDNGRVLLNSIWYPYLNFCTFNNGVALKCVMLEGDKFKSSFGDTDYVSVSLSANDKEIAITLVNYANEESMVDLSIGGFAGFELISHDVMEGFGLNDRNSFDEPNKVVPSAKEGLVEINGENLKISLPKLSYNFIRLKLK